MNKKLKERKAAADDWPHFKRLIELVCSDSRLIDKFIHDPLDILTEYELYPDIDIAKNAISFLMNRTTANEQKKDNPYLKIIEKKIEPIHKYFADMQSVDNHKNDKFYNWFTREKRHISFESKLNRLCVRDSYVPISFELSDGCSIGCPFCCLNAGKLKECFLYTEENATLWKEVLHACKEILGNISGTGVCYFATEPFDNPDYEKFIIDFRDIFGSFPQTTTAMSVHDPVRTKRLFEILGEENLRLALLRFSVVSKQQLHKIHKMFSPEELSCVELLLNNPESTYSYTLAGRSEDLSKKLTKKKFTDSVTSICTAGFVVNMAKKTIMLVSPRRIDKNYPLGMKIYDKKSFDDITSFKRMIHELINTWMNKEIPMNSQLTLGSFISYKRNNNYLRITGDKIHRTITIDDNCYRCFTLLVESGYTLERIFMENNYSGHERSAIIDKLQLIYNYGYLTER